MSRQFRSSSFLLFLTVLFFTQIAFGQLPDFTLAGTATNETCTANASITYAVSGTEPGATLIYRIFKLPDTITPIVVTSASTFGGLTAGDYRIVAIQSLGGQSNTQQIDLHIDNQIVPVVFNISGQPATYCGTTASMTVNATQGNPVSYEVISGPLTFPPQPSPVFSGLPPGDYVVRVNDNCGDGVVQAYHFEPPPPNLNLALVQNCDLIDCNTKSIAFDITALANTAIGYPLQVEIVLIAQGFPTVGRYQAVVSGGASQVNVPFAIPYHDVASYQIIIRVTDACGNVIPRSYLLQMQPKVDLVVNEFDACDGRLDIGLCNMLAPFTVTFVSAPAGFNPADFNASHPGPFATGQISYVPNAQHDLPEGNYVVQITDACGRTVSDSAEIVKKVTDHKLVTIYENCLPQYYVFIPNEGISPATVVLTSAPVGYPGTVPGDMSDMISGGNFSMHLPTAPGTYVFTGVNICGDTYTRTVTILNAPPELAAEGSIVPACVTNGSVTIKLTNAPPIATVVMTAAPASYPNAVPRDVSGFIVSDTSCIVTGLPLGSYTFVVTDACGTTYPPVSATIAPGTAQNVPTVEFLRGCEIGMGSMRMKSPISKLVQVIITSAPSGFAFALPYDVSFNIVPATGIFYMNSLPQGTYIFHTKDLCDIENDVTVQLPGSQVSVNQVNVISNCGSFDLALNYVEAPPFVQEFWLQRFNPTTGNWEHPLSGVVYPVGTAPNNTNSYRIINLATNYNTAALGTFRVLKRVVIFGNGSPAIYTDCYIPIKEFDFTGELSIVSTGAVPCSNSSYDVFITAQGIAPYTYRITEKDGQPFLVNNGNSNNFSGLASGIYNFQVEDSCGNIVNRLVDITTLELPSVFPNNLCEGQNAQLSVQAISFLSYQWWNANAPGTILSTTNELAFSPFSNATTPGTYYVRIYSTNNLSCIDMTIPYVVLPSVVPNAGTDGNRMVCGNAANIDLFTLLGTPYDAGGIWTETSVSGALNANNWTPNGIAYGTYSFVYSVTNSVCNITDTANVTIHLNPTPNDPVIHVGQAFCSDETIELQADDIAGATYHWIGPNNFSSNLQNPIIQNSTAANGGTYTVTVGLNGCESSAAVTLDVAPLPNFKIDAGCVSGTFTLAVKPNESAVTSYDSYSWTGPNNFNATGNPINLTAGTPGLYTVTVTNAEGCTVAQSVQVANTLCTIPNVITPNGDDFNQNFNLSGLDVKRLEIYSRWGRLVYEANNYIDQWHGQNMNGGELPDSTYYYIIYLRTGDEKQGWVFKQAW